MKTDSSEPDNDDVEEAPQKANESPVRSRSQAKRDADAVGTIALQLTKLPRSTLLTLPLSDEIREAVFLCQQMKKNARSRQLRRVARLLRESDSAPVAEALARPSGKTRRMDDEDHAHELLRVRLLEGGKAALTEFLAKYPSADSQRLRQLIRHAQRVPADARSLRAKREVLRVIRDLARSSD